MSLRLVQINMQFSRFTVCIGTLLAFLPWALSVEAAGPFTQRELAAKADGQLIYETYCAGCHATLESRAPMPSVLQMMNPDRVVEVLEHGVMQEQAKPLSLSEKRAVAQYVTAKRLGTKTHAAALEKCEHSVFDSSIHPAPRDWGFDLHNTRYLSYEQAGLNGDELEQLELAWALAIPDAIQLRSQPSFGGGWMFMGSQDGTVYALDPETACLHWRFHAASEVRTTISIADWDQTAENPQPIAVFGDHLGNVYAVNVRDGSLLWKVRPHTHPNASVTGSLRILGDRVIVPFSSHEDMAAGRADYSCCTFRGAVAMLALATGSTRWIGYSVTEEPRAQGTNSAGTPIFGPSGATVWNSPAIDLERNRVYAATGDNYSRPATGTSDSVIAFDLDTGKQVWVYQATEGGDIWNIACLAGIRGPNCPEPEGPDFDIGAGLILSETNAGRPVLLAGQKSGDAIALNPSTGELLWRVSVGRGGIQGGYSLRHGGGRWHCLHSGCLTRNTRRTRRLTLAIHGRAFLRSI